MQSCKIFFLTTVIGLVVSCNSYQELTKQTPTFANIQMSAAEIQEIVDRNGSISEAEAMKVIAKRNGGKDEWGNTLIFLARSKPEFSFLIVSPGRDGQLEVDEISDYFDWETESITEDFDRDIVFEGTTPLTIGSEK